MESEPIKSSIICYYPNNYTKEEYCKYLWNQYQEIKQRDSYLFADDNNYAINEFINCIVGSVEYSINEDKSQESPSIISKFMISLCEDLNKEDGRQIVKDKLSEIKHFLTLKTIIGYAGFCSDDNIVEVVYDRFSFPEEDLKTAKKEEFAKFIKEFTQKAIKDICGATINKLSVEVKNREDDKKDNLEEEKEQNQNQNIASNCEIKPNSLKKIAEFTEIIEKKPSKEDSEKEPPIRKIVKCRSKEC